MVDWHGRPDPEILGLSADSRQVQPGFLFAAMAGSKLDGAGFVDQALTKGAVAVLAAPDAAQAMAARPVPVVADGNPRRAYARMAARFYRRQPRTMVAVTGTNGKTSVVGFVRQIWQQIGRPAASLGTLGLIAPGHRPGASLTTPDPATLHRMLAEIADQGIEHLALEASSHGLDQHRLDGVRLSAAAFTNLTRDHLDYHPSEQAYYAAKRRLFAELLEPGASAVINADSPYYPDLARLCRHRRIAVIGFGSGQGDRRKRDLRLVGIERSMSGQRLDIMIGRRRRVLEWSLIGDFQAQNLLCALGLVIASGDDLEAALAAVPALTGAPGRIERVATHPLGAPVIVDYAHTPDALRVVLATLRPYASGRLHVVFGCGGDRDPGKRPQMGAIAAAGADRVIVTDDNPRGEVAAAIRAAIMAGCPGASEIGDRAQAIEQAVKTLGRGDLLVIAGKGHETGQIIGSQMVPFSDAEVARAAIAALGSRTP